MLASRLACRLLTLGASVGLLAACPAPVLAFGMPSFPSPLPPKAQTTSPAAGAAGARPPATPQASPSASATPSLPAAVPEGAKHHLLDIQVRGSRFISAETILLAFPYHPGDTVSDAQIQEGLEKIYGLGYFSPEGMHAAVEPLPGGERLILMVQENPILQRVQVTGAKVVPDAKIEALFKDQIGHVLDLNELKKTRDAVGKLYAEKGDVLVQVIPQSLSPDGVLKLKVLEGIIESIRIVGNEETKDYVIRREITQKPGDVYNFTRMQEDLRRVYNLNYFEDLGLKYEPGKDPDKVVVVVTVKEKQTGTFQLSAGWSSLDGPLLIGSIKKDNLFGLGQSVSVDTTISRNPAANINYYNPWIDDQHTFLGVGAYLSRFYNIYARPDFAPNGLLDERRGAFFSVGRPLFGDPVTTHWRHSVRLKMERAHELQIPAGGLNSFTLTGLSDLPQATLTGTAYDTAWSGSYTLTYDDRDYVIDPHSGWFNNLTLEQYLPGLGNLNDTSILLQVNRYLPVPLPWNHTLAIGLQAGDLFSFSGQPVPIYLNYFSVGNYLLRGWQEGQLGGSSFALGSIEYRFPVYSIISGVVFYDNGIFVPQGNFSANLEHAGYGLGVRLNTPLGPLRLDYGWPINDPTDPGGKLYFSIGQKF